jgi:hypothetical protein
MIALDGAPKRRFKEINPGIIDDGFDFLKNYSFAF